MKEDICKEIKRVMINSYGEMFLPVIYKKTKFPYDYYIWLYEMSTNKHIAVIHGYGTEDKPFEIKLLKIDENQTIDKRFYDKDILLEYLKDELLGDMMVYEI